MEVERHMLFNWKAEMYQILAKRSGLLTFYLIEFCLKTNIAPKIQFIKQTQRKLPCLKEKIRSSNQKSTSTQKNYNKEDMCEITWPRILMPKPDPKFWCQNFLMLFVHRFWIEIWIQSYREDKVWLYSFARQRGITGQHLPGGAVPPTPWRIGKGYIVMTAGLR